MPQSQYWQPTGPQKAKLRRALGQAFDELSISLLVGDYFSPESFVGIAPAGVGKTHEYRLNELIEYARMNDWLLDLVAAARERRPKNPLIAEIAGDLGLTLAGPRLDNTTGRPFEEIIQGNARFINPVAFREGLGVLEGQICWVDVPGGGGTGFLVGPDLVVTNDHVIDRILKGHAKWQDVKCRFDYKLAINGTIPNHIKPTEVRLDIGNPLVDSRPPSQFDWNPVLGDARPEETDCALLRLAEKIGDLPVGGDTVDPEAQPRGWIDTTVVPPILSSGQQIFLLQHPKGEPLQLSVGTIKAFNASGTRLRYDANSKDGSSGSPCFNADLQLVALHHAHDPAFPPQWNQAIPLGSVRKVWTDHSVTVP